MPAGRGELAARQQALGQYLRDLIEIAEEHNCAVVVTNQVMSKPDSMSFGDPNVAIGGNILAHAIQVRVKLKKSSGGTTKMSIVFGPGLSEQDALFQITAQGVVDPE